MGFLSSPGSLSLFLALPPINSPGPALLPETTGGVVGRAAPLRGRQVGPGVSDPVDLH